MSLDVDERGPARNRWATPLSHERRTAVSGPNIADSLAPVLDPRQRQAGEKPDTRRCTARTALSEDLDTVRDGARKIRNIVRSILQFARKETPTRDTERNGEPRYPVMGFSVPDKARRSAAW